MAAKVKPRSLLELALHSQCELFEQQWRNAYGTEIFGDYVDHFENEIGVSMPLEIYVKVFQRMVESHASTITDECTDFSMTALMCCIINPRLRKLDLNPLCHMGRLEAQLIQSTLIDKMPCFGNLVELKLRTNEFGYPTTLCTDSLLREVGLSCPRLTILDVSYNNTVTDIGLRSIIPSQQQRGCPGLIKVSVTECDVTHVGIVLLLEGLPYLKFLGYGETGQALMMLLQKNWPNSVRQLGLTNCDNLGTHNRYREEYYQLEFNGLLVSIISNLCPNLNVLKIRVSDSAVGLLHGLPNVSTLDLVYDLHDRSYSSSPGDYTVQYLQLCGAQLVSLAFICNIFSTQLLKVVCDHCTNLNQLSIRCQEFDCDKDFTFPDQTKCVLTNLEKFTFKKGSHDFCQIPTNVFTYVLHKSNVLTDIALTMKNTLFSDFYVERLFSSIQTSKVKSIKIQFPSVHNVHTPVNLTMVSVNALISMCPELEQLGKVWLWTVSSEEIGVLRKHLKVTNSTLVII